MAVLGPRLASDLIFAVGGMDASRILNFQNRNGLNPQEIVARAAAAIGGVNESIMQRWGGLTYITNDSFARYRAGTSSSARKTPRQTEAARPDPIQGTLSGHMLPIGDFEDNLSWSDEYLRDAYEAQIDADLQEVADNFRYRVEADFVNRIMSNAENAIGGGYDVPWAIGTGMNVNFIPPPYLATNFTTSHTHFQFHTNATAADLLALRDQMIKTLVEHGFNKTLTMFVSLADVDSWAAVTGFVEINPSNITVVGSGSAISRFVGGEVNAVPGKLIGFFKTNFAVVEIRYLELLPTTYAFMTQSFGENNVNNGIAVRIHPLSMNGTPGMFGMYPDVVVTSTLNPRLKGINLKATHGIGVNRRLNGVAGQFSASSYSWTAI